MTVICQVCLHSPAVHTHHRKMRSQGGGDESVNLMKVCSRCHNEIHANPAWAYEQGYLIPSWDEVRPLGAEPMQTTIDGREEPWQDAHQHEDQEECPRCHGAGKITKKPKPEQPLEPRKKAVYSIRAPKDEAEDGIEVLTHLVDACVERDVKEGLLQSARGAAYYVACRAFYNYYTRPKGE